VSNPDQGVFADPESGLTLPYRVHRPKICSTARPCGLLLVLHGAGERGTDNAAHLNNDALAWTDPAVQAEFPTVVVYPQCPPDMQWVDTPWSKGRYALDQTPVSKPMTAALALLAKIQAEVAIDPNRILVTGLSMGGYGAWDVVLRHPDLFAGAVPLCGGGDPSKADLLASLPIWAFHGSDDSAVPVRGSRLMIEALQRAGATPRYTEVAGWGHDVWVKAYRDREVLRWLLSQKRGR
jgi:predicted peptidase